jgi:hypothetical protein
LPPTGVNDERPAVPIRLHKRPGLERAVCAETIGEVDHRIRARPLASLPEHGSVHESSPVVTLLSVTGGLI